MTQKQGNQRVFVEKTSDFLKPILRFPFLILIVDDVSHNRLALKTHQPGRWELWSTRNHSRCGRDALDQEFNGIQVTVDLEIFKNDLKSW